MFRYFILFIAIIFSSHAYANQGDIVFVDLQKIVDSSVAAQKAEADIEVKLKDFQKKALAKRDDFQKKSESLKARSSVLSEEVFNQEKAKLLEEVSMVEVQLQENSQKLEAMYNLAQNIIRKNVDSIVAEIAAKKGYYAVLPKSQTVYILAKYEITDEVIKELNKRLPKIDLDS